MKCRVKSVIWFLVAGLATACTSNHPAGSIPPETQQGVKQEVPVPTPFPTPVESPTPTPSPDASPSPGPGSGGTGDATDHSEKTLETETATYFYHQGEPRVTFFPKSMVITGTMNPSIYHEYLPFFLKDQKFKDACKVNQANVADLLAGPQTTDIEGALGFWKLIFLDGSFLIDFKSIQEHPAPTIEELSKLTGVPAGKIHMVPEDLAARTWTKEAPAVRRWKWISEHWLNAVHEDLDVHLDMVQVGTTAYENIWFACELSNNNIQFEIVPKYFHEKKYSAAVTLKLELK